jgi:hypothetical protein
MVRSQPEQSSMSLYPEKMLYKKELVEWLKVKALCSRPGTTKKKFQSIRQEMVLNFYEFLNLYF